MAKRKAYSAHQVSNEVFLVGAIIIILFASMIVNAVFQLGSNTAPANAQTGAY